MAVNGISMMNQNSSTYESRAQFNFSKFTSNVSLDNMDLNNNNIQKAVSETLRARLQNAKRNDEDGIDYKLYVKEDENNAGEKKTKNPTHHILNPGESMMRAGLLRRQSARLARLANIKTAQTKLMYHSKHRLTFQIQSQQV